MRRFKQISFALLLARAAAAQSLPPGPGQATVQKVCTKCHAASAFTSQAHTAKEWADIVHEMQNAGAKMTPREFRLIVAYLARTFPKR